MSPGLLNELRLVNCRSKRMLPYAGSSPRARTWVSRTFGSISFIDEASSFLSGVRPAVPMGVAHEPVDDYEVSSHVLAINC
jgi:hypothetical protein